MLSLLVSTAGLSFTLEEVVEPSLLDYNSARGAARAQLVSENGSIKVKEAAQAAREATAELVESGKSFDEAAKEQGLTPVQIGPFTINDRETQSKDPSYRLLHQKASGLNPGDISEVNR